MSTDLQEAFGRTLDGAIRELQGMLTQIRAQKGQQREAGRPQAQAQPVALREQGTQPPAPPAWNREQAQRESDAAHEALIAELIASGISEQAARRALGERPTVEVPRPSWEAQARREIAGREAAELRQVTDALAEELRALGISEQAARRAAEGL